MCMKKNKILNISNILSIFRLFLSLPLAICLINDLKFSVIIIAVLAYLSDLLDGFFARKLNQITEFGKIIDPLADKVFVATAVIILILLGKIPLWFALVVICRDLLILIGGLFSSLKLKYVIPSNFLGKVTVVIVGLTIILSVFSLSFITDFMYYVATLFCLFSLIFYLKNMVFILQSKS